MKNVGTAAVDAIIERPRGGRPVHLDLGLLPAGRLPARSTRRRSSRWSSAAPSTRCPGTPHRPDARCCRRRRPRAQKAQQDAADRARARSSTSATAEGAATTWRRTTTRPSRRCPTTAACCNEWEKETLGLFLSSHPLKEVRPALRAKVDCSLAELGEQEGRRVGHRRRNDRRVQAHPHQEGRPDDVRHARRPRGPGRGARLQLRLRDERPTRSTSTAWCSCAAAWTTRRRGRPSSSPRRSSPSSPTPEEEVVRAAEEAAPGRSCGGSAARVAGGARELPRGAQRRGRPPPGRPRAAARGGRAAPAARRRVPGVGEQRLLQRAGCPARAPRASSPERPGDPVYRSTLTGCNTLPERRRSSMSAASAAPSATASSTPSGCIAAGCQYLYLYDDEDTGRRFMGCMNKVFRGEIDVEMFEQAERTRQGFGGVKMTGLPLPQCRSRGGARLRRLHRGLRLREPGLLPQAAARGRRRSVRSPRRALGPPCRRGAPRPDPA